MAGYQYSIRVRIEPEDGPETTYNLSAVGGNGYGPKSVRLKYLRQAVQRETISRKLIKRDFGARIEIVMLFQITDMSDESKLMDVFNACCNDDARVWLSLDGGTTEKEVVLPEDGGYEWEPLARREDIGVEVELTLQTAEVGLNLRSIIGEGGGTQWAWA